PRLPSGADPVQRLPPDRWRGNPVMSPLTAPIRPPLAEHRRIIERTITVTRELVVDSGHDTTTEVTGIDRLVPRLALWLIERRRVRALRPRVDSGKMSRRVDAAQQRHTDRYHGLPFSPVPSAGSGPRSRNGPVPAPPHPATGPFPHRPIPQRSRPRIGPPQPAPCPASGPLIRRASRSP